MRFELPKNFRDFVCHKEIEFSTDDFCFKVDYDDVDHCVVEELTKLIIQKLNAISKSEWDTALKRGKQRSGRE